MLTGLHLNRDHRHPAALHASWLLHPITTPLEGQFIPAAPFYSVAHLAYYFLK